MSMQTRAAIGLGSNLGDREAILELAIAKLSAAPGIQSVLASRFFETAPVGGPPGQGPFLNAAAALETSLEPEELHQVLKQIEESAGWRRVVRWGERTLDLDLLLFGEHEIEMPTLTVPHPRMAFRRFVLEPLASIAPDLVHPSTRRTVADLLANLGLHPLRIGLLGWDPETAASLAAEVPDFVSAERLDDLSMLRLSSLQFLITTRTCRSLVSLYPACRPIPTLFLNWEDPASARDDLRAACLSTL